MAGNNGEVYDGQKTVDPVQCFVQTTSRFLEVAVGHVSFSELRQNMARYFDRVSNDREPLVVTRQGGKGNLVIMSEDEFAGWQETVHLLSSPKNAERLAASVRQARAGGAREHELVEPAKPA